MVKRRGNERNFQMENTNKVIKISPRARTNMRRNQMVTRLRLWKMYESILTNIPVDECADRLAIYERPYYKEMRCSIWIRIEAYHHAATLASQFRMPVNYLVDAIFRTIPPEKVQEYYVKMLDIYVKYNTLEATRPTSVLLQNRKPIPFRYV